MKRQKESTVTARPKRAMCDGCDVLTQSRCPHCGVPVCRTCQQNGCGKYDDRLARRRQQYAWRKEVAALRVKYGLSQGTALQEGL